MGANLGNTSLPTGRNGNWGRGLVLLLVLAGILATIWAVARQRPPKLTPEQMVAPSSSEDTRSHGPTLAEEQAGRTGAAAPQTEMQRSGAAVPGGKEPPHPPSNYATLPGVEISLFPDATQRRILDRANHEHCTCECGMTIAECRNEDSTCRHSVQAAAAIVAKEAGDDIAKGLIVD